MQQGVGGVSQEDLGGGGRPQGLLVTDVDDMGQRVRALLVGDADSPEIAGDEDVDRLAQPVGEVTHDLACLARHLPLAAGRRVMTGRTSPNRFRIARCPTRGGDRGPLPPARVPEGVLPAPPTAPEEPWISLHDTDTGTGTPAAGGSVQGTDVSGPAADGSRHA